jgi:ketosteroid isomerase-like protein
MMANRNEIENVLASWAFGYDERDVPRMADCFTADAVMTMDIGGGEQMGPYTGHAEVMQHFTDHHAIQTDQRRHVTTNVVIIEQTDTTASVCSYLTLLVTDSGSTRLQATGAYRDQFVLDGDRWKIRRRHLDLDVHY